MIVFKKASVIAPGSGEIILHPTSLRLSESRISVIGANGSGKSTLVRLINGLVLPVSGKVSVRGLDPSKDGRKLRQLVGFLFSDPAAQLIMPTAIEDVSLSLRQTISNKKERESAALSALEQVGLAEKAHVAVSALSGGQQQLLAIAGVLATAPEILIVDEPTTLLDMRWRAYIGHLLDSLPIQVIEVTHDLVAAAKAERTIVVDEGRVVFDGEPATAIEFYRDLMFK